MTSELRKVATLFTHAEAVVELDDRFNYWLDRYNPIDWSPFLIVAAVFWAALG